MPAGEEFKVSIIADARDVQAKIDQTQRQLVAFTKSANEKAKIRLNLTLARLQEQLRTARRQLAQFRKDGDEAGAIKAQLQIQGLQTNVNQARKLLRDLDKDAKTTGKSFFSLGSIVKDALKAFGAIQIVRSVGGFFQDATSAAISFESAFAGVRKTIDASEQEFNALEQEFKDLSAEIPVAVEQLLRIGELGGQLGIAKDDIIDFTKTIAEIAVSTNLTEEAAATSFARIANIFQEPVSNIENLASSVVDLGNNFATTESEILNFATRIAGAGKVVGLTTADVAAIGTALSSVGVEAEAGGTAVQKALLTINDAVNTGGTALNQFAQVAGTSAKDFAELWKSNPAQAFDLFVKGLGKSGDDASAILEELIAGDVRLQRAFLSLAESGDLLTRAIGTANEAFAENTALSTEANRRFSTTESQLQLLQNRWNTLKVEIGNVIKEAILPVLTFLVDLGESLVGTSDKFKTLASAIKILTAALLTLIAGNVLKGLGALLVGIQARLLTLNATVTASAATTGLLSRAMAAFRLVLVSTTGIIGIVAVAMGFLASQIIKSREEARALQRATEELGQSLNDLGSRSITLDNITNEFDRVLQKVLETDQAIRDASRSGKVTLRSELEGEQEENIALLEERFTALATAAGASQEKIAQAKEELSFFREGVAPTSEEIQQLNEIVGADLPAAFDKLARQFNRTVDQVNKDGKSMQRGLDAALSNIRDQFGETGEVAETIAQEMIEQFVTRVAEYESTGKAYAIGVANGLTANDVTRTLENAGLSVSDTTIAILLDQAIRAKDTGEVYGLLLASGVRLTQAEVEAASNDLAGFVTQTLEANKQNAYNAGQNLANSLGNGILDALNRISPLVSSAVGRIAGAFGAIAQSGALGNTLRAVAGDGVAGQLLAASNQAGRVLAQLKNAQSQLSAGTGGGGLPTGASTGGGGGRGGGGASSALKEAEKAAKEAEDAVEDYNKALEDTQKASQKLAEETQEFFDDIVDSIDEAVQKQKELKQEFDDFVETTRDDLIGNAAERQVELVSEEKDVRDELAKVKAQEVKDDEDKKAQQEDINRLNKELNAILKEREEIKLFAEETGADDFQAALERAQEFADSSEFGRARLTANEAIEAKREEVNAEIAKQQELIDIQRRFLELQAGQTEQAAKARDDLFKTVSERRLLTEEEFNEKLAELGFADLSREAELELLKLAERGKGLEEERLLIEQQQADILAKKQEFFDLAQEAHRESTDAMVEDTKRLINEINQAIAAMKRLRALGGSLGGGGSAAQTVNINNEVNNNVDVERLNRQIVNQVRL